MSASIPVIGLNTTYFFPGTFIAVNFGAGASAGIGNPISALLMGNKLSTAPMAVDGYIYGPDVEGFYVSSENDVIAQAGAGSELHRMYRQFVKTNQSVPVYLLAVTESGGSAATGTMTFATTAAAVGNVRVYVGDDFVDTGIVTGDLSTAIATNVAAQINSKSRWAVTAGVSSSTVTLTAKNKGPRGNKIRFAAKIQGPGVATTSTAQNFANLSGGTTADVWTNALATIASRKFRYIVSPGEDATSSGNLGLLCAQITNQALPINDMRQRVVAGNVDSIGTVNTFAKALNNPRAEVVWQPNSNLTPGELAAAACAAYSLGESQSVPMLNFDSCGALPGNRALWNVSRPFDNTAPSRNDIASALVSGVTPVASSQNGSSYIVSAITTYSQDPVTLNLDPRVRDHHIVTVMDLLADRIQGTCNQQFANKLLADDPAQGARPPGSGVVTPSILKATINKVISQGGEDALLQSVAQSMAATQVNRETSPDSRLSANVQLVPISLLHQITINLNQLSSIA